MKQVKRLKAMIQNKETEWAKGKNKTEWIGFTEWAVSIKRMITQRTKHTIPTILKEWQLMTEQIENLYKKEVTHQTDGECQVQDQQRLWITTKKLFKRKTKKKERKLFSQNSNTEDDNNL